MKVSSFSGTPSLGSLPPAADQEVLQGQEFDAQLRQAAESLKEQSAASAVNKNTGAGTVSSPGAEEKKLRKACQDMEAVFLNMLMSQMRATIPKDPLLGDSNAKNIIQSMLDTEMTKDMAKAGGVGLADMLYRQLAPNLGAPKGRNV